MTVGWIDDHHARFAIDLFDNLLHGRYQVFLERALDHVKFAPRCRHGRRYFADIITVQSEYIETDYLIVVVLGWQQRLQGVFSDRKRRADVSGRVVYIAQIAKLDEKLIFVASNRFDRVSSAVAGL